MGNDNGNANNELDYAALGRKIREVRKSKNLTQEKLAELVYISPNYLSRVETNNGGVISLPTLVKICNALKISMDYLLSESLFINESDMLNLNALTDDDKIYFNTIIKEFIKYKANLLKSLT